jgi:predicted lipoprotein with Yx(FWY)xxD motif
MSARLTSRTSLALVGLAGVAAIAVAGCGGGSSSPAPTSAPTATIGVGSTGVGDVLLNAQNRTLYLFRKDAGPESTCFGACAHNWPPVRATGKPAAAGGGAKASLFGTVKRPDGPPQVTTTAIPSTRSWVTTPRVPPMARA